MAKPDPRVSMAIRVPAEARDWVDKQAEAAGVSRSVVIRAMLSVATAHSTEVRAKVAQFKETNKL